MLTIDPWRTKNGGQLMWMGGVVPLGYRVEARRLIVEPAEAETVRTIFARFAQCRSTTELVRWLTEQGISSRRGTPFSKQALWKLLNNRIYLGEIVHRGQAHPGQHEAIVDAAAWAAVQAVFAVNDDECRRATRGRRSPAFLLAGRQPRMLSLIWLKNHEVPADWDDQAAIFGRMDA